MYPGIKLKNENNQTDNFGSAGVLLYLDNIPYVITCFHCIFTTGMDWTQKHVNNFNKVQFLINDAWVSTGEV
ncbi:MAG: hypothetical protein WBP41_12245, partial [Saprospiraceae bacterium]